VRRQDMLVEWTLVHFDGKREVASITDVQAKEYAEVATKNFGVGKNRKATFEPSKAKMAADDKTKGKDEKKAKRAKDKEEKKSKQGTAKAQDDAPTS